MRSGTSEFWRWEEASRRDCMALRHGEAEGKVSGAVEAMRVAAKGEARAATHGTGNEVRMRYAALGVQLDGDVVRNAQVDGRVKPRRCLRIWLRFEAGIQSRRPIAPWTREFWQEGEVAEDGDRRATEGVFKGAKPRVEVGFTVKVGHAWPVARKQAIPPVEIPVGLDAPLRNVNLMEAGDDVVKVAEDARIEGDPRRLGRIADADLCADRQADVAHRLHVRSQLSDGAQSRIVHQDVFACADAAPEGLGHRVHLKSGLTTV